MAGRVPGRNQSHKGIPRVDPDRRDEAIEEVQRDPSTSSRTIKRRTGIPRTSVLRILNPEGNGAYHIQRVQELQEAEHPRRSASRCCRDLRQTQIFSIKFCDQPNRDSKGIVQYGQLSQLVC